MNINALDFWREKGTKSVPEGVRCGAPLGYETLSKTSVRYEESLCEALQKTYLGYIELTLTSVTAFCVTLVTQAVL